MALIHSAEAPIPLATEAHPGEFTFHMAEEERIELPQDIHPITVFKTDKHANLAFLRMVGSYGIKPLSTKATGLQPAWYPTSETPHGTPSQIRTDT